jgi:hypothetical protein
MPRDLTNERTAHACLSDACQQGRKACPFPTACQVPEGPSERSWLLSDLALLGILCLVIVGFICGWFSGGQQ